eukprot:CAMPEP_0117444500 /NCGR_PEP_ID=MMETSP0759-20121206/5276_1 /TAXON_ID=63605 /ORGANISM="Percolomonas cosmopolitus, Strain WS" /LENGTH=487 /DNA_ID=CAMNT_0005236575 /DNA_START=39 /DNA_END=1499 /DNA_ORIENTATION=+
MTNCPSDPTPSFLTFKEQGNEAFKTQNYQKALDAYSQAIVLCPPDEGKQRAMLFGNRSMAKIKLEQYGGAVIDAQNALDNDPEYNKAYFRMGSAKLALLKYHEALKDFKHVVKLTNDKLARQRVKQCLSEIRRIKFEKAIAIEIKKPSEQVNLNQMLIPNDYDGIKLHIDPQTGKFEISREFIIDMMKRFKDRKLIPKKYVTMILLKALETLKDLPSLYEIKISPEDKITVVGDTHGQYYDLLNLLENEAGLPSKENPFLFNGDLVDRGSFSCEVALTLLAWRAHDPSVVHITRGNHESRHLNRVYGFEGEVKHKYNDAIYDLFQEVFNLLPLAITINSKVLVLHGGIGFEKDGVTLDDIAKVDRNREIPDSGIMTDILWSDPSKANGRHPSQRGVSRAFGPDVSRHFMENNGLDLVIRSHEMKMDGYEIEPEVNLVTLFSAPNYCSSQGNKGSFIVLRGTPDIGKNPLIKQFDAVPHPNVKPMQYS